LSRWSISWVILTKLTLACDTITPYILIR
jgi:hypothetical protein